MYESKMKKEFMNVSDCFFNGHSVKFIDWSPDFRLDTMDFRCPKWFNIQALTSELKQAETLKSIGTAIGEVIGIDASLQYSNNMKLLIRKNSINLLIFTKEW